MRSFYQWLKNGLMSIIIPVHFKRLVFLVTLYHYVKKDPVGVKEVDEQALAVLNDSLHLAKTGTQSLVLPGLMTHSIWNNAQPSDVLLTCPLEDATKAILITIPSWMVYGNMEQIQKDVGDIRQFVLSQSAS